LFASLRNVYLDFSLVLDVGRRRLGLKSFVMEAMLLLAAAAAA